MPKIYREDLQMDTINPNNIGYPADGISLFTDLRASGLFMRRSTEEEKTFKMTTSEDVAAMISEQVPKVQPGLGMQKDDETETLGLSQKFYDYLNKMTFVAPSISEFKIYSGSSEITNSLTGIKDLGFNLNYSDFRFSHAETETDRVNGVNFYVYRNNSELVFSSTGHPPADASTQISMNPINVASRNTKESFQFVLEVSYRNFDDTNATIRKTVSFQTLPRVYYNKWDSNPTSIETNFNSVFEGALQVYEFGGESTDRYIWMAFEQNSDPIKTGTKWINNSTGIEIPIGNRSNPTVLSVLNANGLTLTYNCYRSASLVNDSQIFVRMQ